jgi:hypothetical protein
MAEMRRSSAQEFLKRTLNHCFLQNYKERLVNVATFKTVKEFWALYQHVKLPAYLPQGKFRKN